MKFFDFFIKKPAISAQYEIDCASLHARLKEIDQTKSNVQIIDARTQQEREAYNPFENSLWIDFPRKELNTYKTKTTTFGAEVDKKLAEGQLKTDIETYVYCLGGVRSLDATMVLIQKGFSNVKSLYGGMEVWQPFEAEINRTSRLTQ